MTEDQSATPVICMFSISLALCILYIFGLALDKAGYMSCGCCDGAEDIVDASHELFKDLASYVKNKEFCFAAFVWIVCTLLIGSLYMVVTWLCCIPLMFNIGCIPMFGILIGSILSWILIAIQSQSALIVITILTLSMSYVTFALCWIFDTVLIFCIHLVFSGMSLSAIVGLAAYLDADHDTESHSSSTTIQSFVPTTYPSDHPSFIPSKLPTDSPAAFPTNSPTNFPTKVPTNSPTNSPTRSPEASPTHSPTSSPSAFPTYTISPTIFPTVHISSTTYSTTSFFSEKHSSTTFSTSSASIDSTTYTTTLQAVQESTSVVEDWTTSTHFPTSVYVPPMSSAIVATSTSVQTDPTITIASSISSTDSAKSILSTRIADASSDIIIDNDTDLKIGVGLMFAAFFACIFVSIYLCSKRTKKRASKDEQTMQVIAVASQEQDVQEDTVESLLTEINNCSDNDELVQKRRIYNKKRDSLQYDEVTSELRGAQFGVTVTSEMISSVSKQYPFESYLVTLFSIVMSIIESIAFRNSTNCNDCETAQILTYTGVFFIFISIQFALMFATYPNYLHFKYNQVVRKFHWIGIVRNLLIFMTFLLNSNQQPLACIFGARQASISAFIMAILSLLYAKIESNFDQQLKKRKKQHIDPEIDKLDEIDRVLEATSARIKDLGKFSKLDRILEWSQQFSKEYSFEISISVAYASIMNPLKFYFVGCFTETNGCTPFENFCYWLAFVGVLLMLIAYYCRKQAQQLQRQVWRHVMLVIALIFMVEKRPLSCLYSEFGTYMTIISIVFCIPVVIVDVFRRCVMKKFK